MVRTTQALRQWAGGMAMLVLPPLLAAPSMAQTAQPADTEPPPSLQALTSEMLARDVTASEKAGPPIETATPDAPTTATPTDPAVPDASPPPVADAQPTPPTEGPSDAPPADAPPAEAVVAPSSESPSADAVPAPADTPATAQDNVPPLIALPVLPGPAADIVVTGSQLLLVLFEPEVVPAAAPTAITPSAESSGPPNDPGATDATNATDPSAPPAEAPSAGTPPVEAAPADAPIPAAGPAAPQPTVTPTTAIPYIVGRSCYHWSLTYDPVEGDLLLSEELRLPGPARNWNGTAYSEVNAQRSIAITPRHFDARTGTATAGWCVAKDDPMGSYRYIIRQGDREVARFDFTVGDLL